MGVTEYRFPGAIVRIHDGKLTAEERRANFEAAATQYMREVMKQKRRKEQEKKSET